MGAAADSRTYYPNPRVGKKGSGRLKTDREIKEEIEQRFREDVAEAQWEHGHGGYTGTIAECPGIGRFHDKAFTDGTLRKDTELVKLAGGEFSPYQLKTNEKISGRRKALIYGELLAEKWEPAEAVSFMYSRGKGKRKRKAWAVVAICSD